jgi:hypothetical protein
MFKFKVLFVLRKVAVQRALNPKPSQGELLLTDINPKPSTLNPTP